MKLFYSKGACSLACRIIINELGLSSEYESVDLHNKPKLTETGTDFSKINPKGSVPTLLTDDDEILTENVAILQYLADKGHASELIPQPPDFNHYRVLEWLNYISSDVHKSLGVFFNPQITPELRNKLYMPVINKHLKYIDNHLTNNNFLITNHFTLPDAYFFVMTTWIHQFKLQDGFHNINRYYNSLMRRSSIQQSLKDEQIILATA